MKTTVPVRVGAHDKHKERCRAGLGPTRVTLSWVQGSRVRAYLALCRLNLTLYCRNQQQCWLLSTGHRGREEDTEKGQQWEQLWELGDDPMVG